MDSSEIRTLRHKRYLLVTSLVIDDDIVQQLSLLKLMTPKMVASIQVGSRLSYSQVEK